jgi:hypothetical protein
MKLSIINCPDKEFRPYVKRAAHFYLETLVPSKRMRENIFIQIKFDSKIDVFGSACIEEYNASNKPREFLIEIHPGIGAKNMLKTLAHEMVHIKQFINLETNESLSKWHGAPIDPDSIDYYSHPWEMEAHSYENGLLTMFAIREQLWTIFEEFYNPTAPIEIVPIKWKNKSK